MRAALAEPTSAMREGTEISMTKRPAEGDSPTRLESLVSVDERAIPRDPEPRARGSLCVELALHAAAAPSVISATVVIASALSPSALRTGVEPPRP